MNIDNGLLIAAAVVCSISAAPAFAKTAKECTAEWRADKAEMQARGVTEKAYVEQCRVGATPAASAPPPNSSAAAPPPPAAPSGSERLQRIRDLPPNAEGTERRRRKSKICVTLRLFEIAPSSAKGCEGARHKPLNLLRMSGHL